MTIQWFPGHMNAARKKAAESMESTDLVIEVLDARIPMASTNPMVEQLRLARQRPALKILNKADLADAQATAQWLAYFNAQKNVHAVALSCKNPSDVAKLPNIAKQICPHRAVPTKPLRMMIMGIPNVGKSTLMNALLKKRVANVGDEPAVTKAQQRLYLGKDMVLVDTPGMLWPKIMHPTDGLMLAASHAVGVNAVIEEEVATFLAEILQQRYPQLLAQRYAITAATMQHIDAVGVIESIAQKRAYRIKGGELDFEKASHTLLLDYRSGALGRVSLETPTSREHLLANYVEPESQAEGKYLKNREQDDDET